MKIYPDLDIDQPPLDEALWKKRELPSGTIITQGAQSVGYIWTLGYEVLYYLEYFVVEREHRGKGIGTKALQHIKKQAKELGYRRWGLDCDPNHPIAYRMYTKAGMSKVGEVYHLKAPYSPSLTKETNMNVMVVYDPEQWPVLEDKYSVPRGCTKRYYPSGMLPVILMDANGQTRGFVLFTPSSFRMLNLAVDSPDELLSFLSLLQDLKEADANPEWIDFWILRGKAYADIVLSSVPNAALCEQYDLLEGSTA